MLMTASQETINKEKRVSRLEVIDETGRAYTRYGVKIELSYQDDDRTLKVFVRTPRKDNDPRVG